ncbi:DUF2093 domain-containing protein [Candidatus Pelagibacter communis]|uniref:DUF2093 domain-containing protein n=1 Tax=Pelagibacter ubique TaxID=198252 RepID=UPI00065B4580|nr:DUF2093 domain-containing protein [Candidatus Pelagibacter ubique]
MKNKLAKLKYLPNNFNVLETGDHVLCAISGKKIMLENLTYWNVDKQEAYYSYIEAHKKRDEE